MIRKLSLARYAQIAKCSVANYFEEKHPFYASFKVTSRCHFGCKFCDMKYYQVPDMSTDECIRILRNLGKSSIFLLSMEGGDPLLRKDIEELLIEAHRQPYYLLFTTSERTLMEYPWDVYQKYIDFLHISIDEGHGNLELLDALPEINKFDMVVCVQTVVAEEDQPFLEAKVKRCYETGCKILVMPAVHLDRMENRFPNLDELERDVLRFKEKYPETIITPNAYFKEVRKIKGGCSPSSIIIDADGGLFYPCRTLLNKTIKLQDSDLTEYLSSPEARKKRKEMANCERQCGWYQYFATSRFSSIGDFVDAAGPYLREFITGNPRKLKK